MTGSNFKCRPMVRVSFVMVRCIARVSCMAGLVLLVLGLGLWLG